MQICYECKCSPTTCSDVLLKCGDCVVENCCCISVHSKSFKVKKKLSVVEPIFKNVKKMFVAALGIEILCILSAELGQNIGLYFFGLNLHGIIISEILGFMVAGFTTFMAIVGRYNFDRNAQSKVIDGCCSFLENNSNKGFLFSLVSTFLNFKKGLIQFIIYYQKPQMKEIMTKSIIILITAESACILTAEMVTILFYQYSVFLTIPLSLLAGTFALTMVESIRKTKEMTMEKNYECENNLCQECGSVYLLQDQFVPLSKFRMKNDY